MNNFKRDLFLHKTMFKKKCDINRPASSRADHAGLFMSHFLMNVYIIFRKGSGGDLV